MHSIRAIARRGNGHRFPVGATLAVARGAARPQGGETATISRRGDPCGRPGSGSTAQTHSILTPTRLMSSAGESVLPSQNVQRQRGAYHQESPLL